MRRIAFFVIILIFLAFVSRACEGPTKRERGLQVKYDANQIAEELAFAWRLARESKKEGGFEDLLGYYAHEVENVKTVVSPMNKKPFLFNSKPEGKEAVLLTTWKWNGQRLYYGYFSKDQRLVRVSEKRVLNWGTNKFRPFPADRRQQH